MRWAITGLTSTNNDDNLTKATNPANASEYYYYDGVGCGGCGDGARLTKVQDASGAEVEWRYDADGLLTKTIDALDVETDYFYNQYDLLTKVESPSGSGVDATVTYDAAGRMSPWRFSASVLASAREQRGLTAWLACGASGGRRACWACLASQAHWACLASSAPAFGGLGASEAFGVAVAGSRAWRVRAGWGWGILGTQYLIIVSAGASCYSPSMARVARVVSPGMPHHSTQRGNRRMPTFLQGGRLRRLS